MACARRQRDTETERDGRRVSSGCCRRQKHRSAGKPVEIDYQPASLPAGVGRLAAGGWRLAAGWWRRGADLAHAGAEVERVHPPAGRAIIVYIVVRSAASGGSHGWKGRGISVSATARIVGMPCRRHRPPRRAGTGEMSRNVGESQSPSRFRSRPRPGRSSGGGGGGGGGRAPGVGAGAAHPGGELILVHLRVVWA
jgi:hypothetical protein